MESKAFSAAVVGPAGVGRIHARELVRNACTHLAVAASSQQSAERSAADLCRSLGITVEAMPTIDALADGDASFISICSPTPLHQQHIQTLACSKAYLFVEKPLFWTQTLTLGSVEAETAQMLSQADGRISVNYPCASLARSFLKTTCWSGRPKSLAFSYYTRGRSTGHTIAVDLLPHALSFLFTILPDGAENGEIRPVRVHSGLRRWEGVAIAGETRCLFDLVHDTSLPESKLGFTLDGTNVQREQNLVEGRADITFVVDGRSIEVENPMSEEMGRAITAFRSGRTSPDDTDLTRAIMRGMVSLLNSGDQC